MMKESTAGAYRAVISKTYPENHEKAAYGYKLHYGPYATVGAAKGILTVEMDAMERWLPEGCVLDSWVEHTDSEWKRVEA